MDCFTSIFPNKLLIVKYYRPHCKTKECSKREMTDSTLDLEDEKKEQIEDERFYLFIFLIWRIVRNLIELKRKRMKLLHA